MAITKTSNSGLTGIKYNDIAADNNYMETIASTLVGAGGSSSIIFNNIPQGYKHLQIRAITRDGYTGGNGNNMGIYVNGDTSSNYAVHYMLAYSGGSETGSGANNPYIIGNFGATSTTAANCFGVGITDILDYSNTNKYKTTRTITGVEDSSAGQARFWSGLWMNTAAITSLTLFPQNSVSYVQYSRFSLYGIKG
jgi:hypothetical protein